MKLDYIYISIGLLTLIINIILLITFLKLNFSKKENRLRNISTNVSSKKTNKQDKPIGRTMGVDDENLSYANSKNNEVLKQSNNHPVQDTELVGQGQDTEILSNNDTEILK